MKRFLVLVIILAIFNFPFSCNPCGSGGVPQKIELVSIGSENGSYADGMFSLVESNEYQSAAIRVKVDETKSVNLSQLNGQFTLLSASYACSPIEPQVQLLTQIGITSNKPVFSEGVEYKANEDLVDLFVIQYFEEYTIPAFIDYHPSNPYILANQSNHIIFQLRAQPDNSIFQNFTFTLTFDDGLTYQTVTPLFTVE